MNHMVQENAVYNGIKKYESLERFFRKQLLQKQKMENHIKNIWKSPKKNSKVNKG